jgi:transcriptional regulator with XRE-family HTH domain
MTPDELRQWRDDEGLAIKDACALFGVSERTYYYWEAGKTSHGTTYSTLPKLVELAWRRIEDEARGTRRA